MKRIVLMVSVALVMVALTLTPVFAATPRENLARNLSITSTTIDPQTKEVTVKGKVTCAPEVGPTFVAAHVSQVVGRLHTLENGVQNKLRCNGRTPFALQLSAQEGQFAPGEATLQANVLSCLPRFKRCDEDRRRTLEVWLVPRP